jgi:hypothetical protein
MTPPPDATTSRAGNIALTISALVLLAVLVVVAGRPAPAAAAEVSQSGDYTALTCDGGNEDILVVLDGRTEQLFVYKVQNQNSLQLMQREDVSRIFSDARSRLGGNP